MKILNLQQQVFYKYFMQHIFVYGTLQLPEIVKKLTGKTFNSIPAVLPGFRCCCIKNRDYPAVTPDDNAETAGLLLEKVDDFSLKIISFFEGDEYQLQKVTVLINGKSQVVQSFVWAKGLELLEDREWVFHRFEKESLEHYLNVVIPEFLEWANSN